MLASVTEVEVELHVPEDKLTFFGVTWAQDPRDHKVFIKALPRSADGSRGLLESTGLVETGDCLTAINGDVIGGATLHEVMAAIRSARSPVTLRFVRYPPPKDTHEPTSPGSHGSGSSLNGGATRGSGAGEALLASPGRVRSDAEAASDSDLDAVLNSPLVLGLGERVAGIQQRNARLLQTVERAVEASAAKRAGVEAVACASAALASEATTLSGALQMLVSAREAATALCETMARLDDSLAARERAAVSRRRLNEGPGPRGVGGALGGAIP